MATWKSYHLMSASFADTGEAPGALLRWAVERVVDGLVDHEAYDLAVAQAARRGGTLQRMEQRMAQLLALDANPIASLMRTAADAATLQRRWNGFNGMAPLGVQTRMGSGLEPALQRQARVSGLQDDLRSAAGAQCVANLREQCQSPVTPAWQARPIGELATTLAHGNAAVHDSIDMLYANPFAELDDCAVAVGTARRTLQRAFTQAGLSFRLMRQAIRLTLAGQAMRTGGSSLTDIAHACGFFDSAHLNHAWSQSCGLTPSQYCALC